MYYLCASTVLQQKMDLCVLLYAMGPDRRSDVHTPRLANATVLFIVYVIQYYPS